MLLKLKRIRWKHVAADTLAIVFSLYVSLFLRIGPQEAGYFLPVLNKLLIYFVFIRVATLMSFGVYDIIWRYISFRDSLAIVRAVALSSALVIAFTFVWDIGRLPRTSFFIDAGLVTLLLLGSRYAWRFFQERKLGRALALEGDKTLIFGAGALGRALAHRFQTAPSGRQRFIGFVDDDPKKVGRQIAGAEVLGTRHELAELVEAYQVKQVWIAVDALKGEVVRELVNTLRPLHVVPRIVDSRFWGIRGTDSLRNGLRKLELSDLLKRPKKQVDLTEVKTEVEGKVVLVTGAGGSIGSELCRQILAMGPKSLLLLDHAELNLYQIDSELKGSADTGELIPILADIKDESLMDQIFAEYRPQLVFHAAAYKHVHLVEKNPYSSILNNVLGTRNLVRASEKYDVESFVLISSDKAVNPIGIMGATKRAGELIVSEVGNRTQKRYCAVRFGNVLGSSGSLVPSLVRQIEAGGPVTVTHPDMTRYFMLIPEAVSLVLKASKLCQPGDIAILDMGEPIAIVELAQSLISLMGKTEKEISIVYTGIRPGEKMYEELYLNGNELKTDHPEILVLPRGDRQTKKDSEENLEKIIDQVIEKSQAADKEAIFWLNRLMTSRLNANTLFDHLMESDEKERPVAHSKPVTNPTIPI